MLLLAPRGPSAAASLHGRILASSGPGIAEAGRGKYACEGMAVIYDVLDSAVCEIDRLLA